MKLQTSIHPRRDGTVKLTGLDGKEYVFSADDSGDMVCVVEDRATIKHVLQAQGDYVWPADEDSMTEAERLLADDLADDLADQSGLGDSSDLGESGNPADGDPSDPGDDPVDPNALPLEANTPPVTAPGKGKKAQSQKAPG